MLYLIGHKARYNFEKLNNQLFYVMDTSDLTMEPTNAKTILDDIRDGISFDNCSVSYNRLQLQSHELPQMLYEHGNLMVHKIDHEHFNMVYSDMFFSYDGTDAPRLLNGIAFTELPGNKYEKCLDFLGLYFFGKEIRQGKETNKLIIKLGDILYSLNLDTLEISLIFECFTYDTDYEDRLKGCKGMTVWSGGSNIRHCTIPEYKRHIIIKGSY